MTDMTELERRCIDAAKAANDKHCARYAVAHSADDWQINAMVRAVLTEAGVPELMEALKRIAYTRPAGDIDTAKGTRALVKHMESIAITAIAKVQP